MAKNKTPKKELLYSEKTHTYYSPKEKKNRDGRQDYNNKH